VYAWLVLAPEPVWPSPKLQSYETIRPPESVDAAALNATRSGDGPEVGVAEKIAVGGVLNSAHPASAAVSAIHPIPAAR